MEIYFTIEATTEVNRKLLVTGELSDEIKFHFGDKQYSPDLACLYICLSCLNPSFASFYPRRKSRYTAGTKKYTISGTELEKKAKTYEYELRLEFDAYNKLSDIRDRFSKDVINSLDSILECKKIKQLDLERFKSDFKQFFQNVGWFGSNDPQLK